MITSCYPYESSDEISGAQIVSYLQKVVQSHPNKFKQEVVAIALLQKSGYKQQKRVRDIKARRLLSDTQTIVVKHGTHTPDTQNIQGTI